MGLYRLYLSDAGNFLQRTVVVECSSDMEAVDHARTLIKVGGRIDLWSSDGVTGPWIGSPRSRVETLSFAYVKRIGSRPMATPLEVA